MTQKSDPSTLMGGKSKTQILVGILAMSSMLMAYSAIMPILSEVSKSFPDASDSAVQMVYSIAMLVALPFMLASGTITQWISKKNLGIIGAILAALGVLPVFLHGSLVQVYIGSAFVGAGTGIMNIISSALISDYYKGVEKGRIMGYQSAALSLLGGILAFGGGQIAALWHWWYSFALFLVAIPIAIIIFVCLPDNGPEPMSGSATKAVYSKELITWALLAFVFSLFMYAFNTNISMFIEEAGFGGSDVSGGVSTMFSLIGIPAGFVVGACVKALRRNVVGTACMCCALGMIIIGVAPNLAVVYIGAFLFGVGFAIRNPCVVTFAAYIVPAAGAGAAIALVQASGMIAGFLSPFVVNAVGSLFGGDLRMTFIAVGVILVVLSVCYFVLNPVKNEDIEADAE